MQMNRRGQIISIIFVVATIVCLLLAAPILFKMVVVPSQKFSSALTIIDPTNVSVNAVDYTINTFEQWFDWCVFFFILFSIVLLLFSSFMIDVHPAFFFIYFIAIVCIMIFAPLSLQALDRIYDCDNYMSASYCSDVTTGWTAELAHLPVTAFIYNHFNVVILSIMILSGVVMYGKFRFGGGSSGGGY